MLLRKAIAAAWYTV